MHSWKYREGRLTTYLVVQIDTCEVTSSVNGARSQLAHRSRSRIPASWAIKSSSAGHT